MGLKKLQDPINPTVTKNMFHNQLREVLNNYSKLYQKDIDEITIIKGGLDIIDKYGEPWDTYEIEIYPSKEFPKRFPILFEVGNKIPKNADWHINPDGSCCLTVPPKEIIACKNGISLSQFIKNWVIPFLANQTHRRIEGYYINGEYAHGILGLLEYYQEIMLTKDIKKIVELISMIFKIRKPKQTSICFCGSKNKFRKCHREAYEKILIIGREQVISDISKIVSYLEKQSS